MVKISQIKMPLDYKNEDLIQVAAKHLKIPNEDIAEIKLIKKSVDARKKNDIHFVLGLEVRMKNDFSTEEKKFPEPEVDLRGRGKRPVIAGSGPAGMFAALTLAKAGLKPLIIERGKSIDERIKDVERFETTGVLDTQSNIQFGEGGAGTFSDGKLTTGIKDKRIGLVLETFYQSGAPKEILYEAKPHIGTDILRNIMVKMRRKILALGGEFSFETQLVDFECDEQANLKCVVVIKNGKRETIKTDTLILAIGHSARDTIEMLFDKNVNMIQKPFSVGVRIEHKQEFINKAQYGKFYNHPVLGAADYKLSSHLKNGRGVYTFCMCPGGSVVAASSEANMVCVNGMSRHKRDGENANSAVLVSVMPSDFADESPLCGIEFQRSIERKAFELGGENYKAPVQLVKDFIGGRVSSKMGNVKPTYPIGYKFADMRELFPHFVTESLREGLLAFERNIKGFSCSDAVLTGAETRSSSPVRIVRDESMQCNIKGIYPCGEGAGYAGGIMSSAVDGIKTAERIIENEIAN